MSNWRLPKPECRDYPAMRNAAGWKISRGKNPRKMTLNIRHGNGASVVVRGRESRLHGEGRQDVNQFIKRKGAWGIMRSPENVLESLKSKACNKSYKYERLYRNLYNPQFYLLAYQRIQAKPGNMTAGTDGKTIDGMGMARISDSFTIRGKFGMV